jgi:hypothetical protein
MRHPLPLLPPRVEETCQRAELAVARAQSLVEASQVARLARDMPEANALTWELTAWVLASRGLL